VPDGRLPDLSEPLDGARMPASRGWGFIYVCYLPLWQDGQANTRQMFAVKACYTFCHQCGLAAKSWPAEYISCTVTASFSPHGVQHCLAGLLTIKHYSLTVTHCALLPSHLCSLAVTLCSCAITLVLSCYHACALVPSHCALLPSHLCSLAITLVLLITHKYMLQGTYFSSKVI